MTDPTWDDALHTLAEAFGEPAHKLVRAKCPACGRWCLRSPYLLTVRCVMCEPTGEPWTYFDQLLMVEFRLSWEAYQRRLETDGPPWLNPRTWVHSRDRQTRWNRAHGSGRRESDDTEGGRGQ